MLKIHGKRNEKKRENFMNVHQKLKSLVKNERIYTVQILKLFIELIETREYCELGYSSLFEYAQVELAYSADQAYRRISAAKILKKLPALENDLLNGELTLSHLTKAIAVIKSQKMNREETCELLLSLKQKSARDTDKILSTINPKKVKKEKAKPVAENINEILTHLSDEDFKILEEVKQFLRNDSISETLSEVLKFYKSKMIAKKIRAVKIKKEFIPKGQIAIDEVIVDSKFGNVQKNARPRYINANIKKNVTQKANGQCEFVGTNGRRCECKTKLEFAHIKAFAHGGENSEENLKLFCKSHNQFDAIKVFGREKMQQYLEVAR
jgi:sulfur relay (sulfurtransferase) DsrC/TusE family protein